MGKQILAIAIGAAALTAGVLLIESAGRILYARFCEWRNQTRQGG